MLHTTFEAIRSHGFSDSGYRKLAKSLGDIKAYGRDTPIPLTTIVKSNGIADALWCLRAVQPSNEIDRVLSRFLVAILSDPDHGCLSRLKPSDDQQRSAIGAVVDLHKRRLEGKPVGREEWGTARGAAWDAAHAAHAADAEYAARAARAARDAAWTAATGATHAESAAAWAVEAVAEAVWDAASAVEDTAWLAAQAAANAAVEWQTRVFIECFEAENPETEAA